MGNTEIDLVETKHGTEELSLPIISNGKIEMTGKPEVVSIGSQTHVSDSIKRNSYHLGSSIILWFMLFITIGNWLSGKVKKNFELLIKCC